MEDDVVEKTIAAYTARATEYIGNTDSLSYFPNLLAMLEQFVAMLPGKKVVDVAFGSGRDIFYLMDQGLQVEGIELNKVFIDRLKAKVAVPLHLMDMRRLTFESRSFDGIWCCSALLHVPRQDARPTLEGFKRVLVPNGMLYVDLKEGVGEKWVSTPDGNITNTPRFFTYYQREEVCTLLEQAGFKIEFTETQSYPKDNHKTQWLHVLARKTPA